MKNKGRRHKAGNNRHSPIQGMSNCKGCVAHVTRPITSMSSKGFASGRFDKKKWIKRIRGYFKSQTKDLSFSDDVSV